MTRPLLLRLPRAALARRDAVERLAPSHVARSLFALHGDELAFARALLARRSDLWLYRTSQRAFAGDFVVVAMSSPCRASRAVFVAELKRGERLRVGAPSSVQLRNAGLAVRELVASGIVGDGCAPRGVVGDALAVLSLFGRAGTTRRSAIAAFGGPSTRRSAIAAFGGPSTRRSATAAFRGPPLNVSSC
jgi:hypothetical protein